MLFATAVILVTGISCFVLGVAFSVQVYKADWARRHKIYCRQNQEIFELRAGRPAKPHLDP